MRDHLCTYGKAVQPQMTWQSFFWSLRQRCTIGFHPLQSCNPSSGRRRRRGARAVSHGYTHCGDWHLCGWCSVLGCSALCWLWLWLGASCSLQDALNDLDVWVRVGNLLVAPSILPVASRHSTSAVSCLYVELARTCCACSLDRCSGRPYSSTRPSFF